LGFSYYEIIIITLVYTQQSFPTCVASSDLLTPLPRRWRQGRCKTALTWRTCPLRVQRKLYGSFRQATVWAKRVLACRPWSWAAQESSGRGCSFIWLLSFEQAKVK